MWGPYYINISPTAFTWHAQQSSWTFCWGPVLQCTLLMQQQLSGSLRPAFLNQTVS